MAYYGCFLVRPPKITGIDYPENTQLMDRLLDSLGAEVLDWSGKVDCCGGSLALSKKDIVVKLVGDIIDRAQSVGTEAIVTACPLCQANLETRQSSKEKLPLLYFTELMGVAMGIAGKAWLKKHLISPLPLLNSHGLL